MAADFPYPISPDQVYAWASRNHCHPIDAERRYAHYLTLRSLADHPEIRQWGIVYGGAVGSYVYGNRRTPRDVDLGVEGRSNESFNQAEREALMRQTSEAISAGTRKFCPDFVQWRDKLRELIHVELYGANPYFRVRTFNISPTGQPAILRVVDVSAVVGAKYGALFDDRPERKWRSLYKDIFDMAWLITRHGHQMDSDAVISCVVDDPLVNWSPDKSAMKQIEAGLKDFVIESYEKLRKVTGDQFIELSEASRIVGEYFESAVERRRQKNLSGAASL